MNHYVKIIFHISVRHVIPCTSVFHLSAIPMSRYPFTSMCNQNKHRLRLSSIQKLLCLRIDRSENFCTTGATKTQRRLSAPEVGSRG